MHKSYLNGSNNASYLDDTSKSSLYMNDICDIPAESFNDAVAIILELKSHKPFESKMALAQS